jgi:site-specific recombinase XerD
VFINKGEYWIRYADQHGKIHREKVGPFLEPAKAAVEKRRTEVRERKFLPERFRERSVLFGEVATDYLKHAKGQKRTWRDSEDHLQALLEILKDAPVAELTPGRLESVLNELSQRRGWSPATFNRHRSTLSATFQCAIRNGKAETNPARSVAHRKENNQRVRYLTAEEETRLMTVIRSRWPERESEIVVALHSGMRRSEQFQTHEVSDGGLKWEHINLKSGVLRLPRSKSGKARPIPINSVLRQTLLAIQRTTSPYVFAATDPNKWFVKACQPARVEDFHWHDLRHTFASRLVMAGVPIRTVAELLGHSDISTTMRYAHLAPGHLAAAVECLTAPQPLQTDTTIDTEAFRLSKKVGF